MFALQVVSTMTLNREDAQTLCTKVDLATTTLFSTNKIVKTFVLNWSANLETRYVFLKTGNGVKPKTTVRRHINVSVENLPNRKVC